jgi:hypothetical protein
LNKTGKTVVKSSTKLSEVNVKDKSEAVSGRRRDNIMAKRKRTKVQAMIYKTLHLKQKVEHHDSQ